MATLVEATAPADLESVRELFVEYARGVDEPCCFTSFDAEVAALPHGYFALLLAKEGAAAGGCVGLRRLDGRTAEMKRLYVRSEYRGCGVGRALAEAAIVAARSAGHRRVVLDSLPKMSAAQSLYRLLDFREVAPYLAEPTPGATCFELSL